MNFYTQGKYFQNDPFDQVFSDSMYLYIQIIVIFSLYKTFTVDFDFKTNFSGNWVPLFPVFKLLPICKLF